MTYDNNRTPQTLLMSYLTIGVTPDTVTVSEIAVVPLHDVLTVTRKEDQTGNLPLFTHFRKGKD